MRSIYDDGSNPSLLFHEWQDAVSGLHDDADPSWPYESGQQSGAAFRREQLARREARLDAATTTLFGMTRAEVRDQDARDTIPF
ncbi:hypothetical protein [Methylobacterium sp. Leaf117]|uniref:hypothetical protein n=1 Tax=Methylobacterium sp. Leaf117 TaxID=1736260 RepID=UPI000701AA17|nr:hypothetical protein [Methylobacterium sp. Leaf117]KQP92959.1 hypothetical protein ASF57_22645 [Methylobacterium sp. Leaf117]